MAANSSITTRTKRVILNRQENRRISSSACAIWARSTRMGPRHCRWSASMWLAVRFSAFLDRIAPVRAPSFGSTSVAINRFRWDKEQHATLRSRLVALASMLPLLVGGIWIRILW